jgi:hypothetical protein
MLNISHNGLGHIAELSALSALISLNLGEPLSVASLDRSFNLIGPQITISSPSWNALNLCPAYVSSV